jgi:hypothetical protein
VKTRRRAPLTLHKETLHLLTASHLRGAAGGNATTNQTTHCYSCLGTCPTQTYFCCPTPRNC